MRLRPRALVEVELQYVTGKLNELDLPTSAKRTHTKVKGTVKYGDISLLSEKWKKWTKESNIQ